MARRNHLDDFTRERMIGMLEEGRTVTRVAAELGTNKIVVSRTWKAFQITATGRQVSRFTVTRRLHKGGLFARRPERCLALKVDHRLHRLQWCREHKNWTTVNGVVSSLRMRVGSVPEAILNAFDLERERGTVLYQ
ncbi:HTH_Tnp_Tc3_2 domain-containing protein [Trichonephila clavipes]|nr:HTH_Tnp_Tc3_2 domain-containing protein [Trichonephila clavipes]